MAWQCRILVTGSRDWPDTDVAYSTVYCAVIEVTSRDVPGGPEDAAQL